jgi:hypothetical protein
VKEKPTMRLAGTLLGMNGLALMTGFSGFIF